MVYSLSLSSSILPSPQSLSATLASLRFLGSLPLPFPLSGMVHVYSFVPSFTSGRSLFNCHLCNADSQPSGQMEPPPYSLFLCLDLFFLVLWEPSTFTIETIWEINNSEHNLDHCFTYEFPGSNLILNIGKQA